MPDNERARLLAKAAACLIIILLYALGGASLYLRAHYLSSDETPLPVQMPPRTPVVTEDIAIGPSPSATPTLYPTITPDLTKTAQAQHAP